MTTKYKYIYFFLFSGWRFCFQKKKRFLAQPTKKANCPARLKLREVVAFPDYKVCKLKNCSLQRQPVPVITSRWWLWLRRAPNAINVIIIIIIIILIMLTIIIIIIIIQ